MQKIEYIRKPILRSGEKKELRVLWPEEYKAIYAAAGKYKNQVILDTLLLTAGRITELKEMQINRQWFDFQAHAIHVMEHKEKRREKGLKDRYIHLSTKGVEVIRSFLYNKFYIPSYSTIQENLIRWAEKANVDPAALSGKVFRKTYESWLMFYYPMKSLSILQSTGNSEKVALEHYLNLPFTEEDRILMKDYVDGWM